MAAVCLASYTLEQSGHPKALEVAEKFANLLDTLCKRDDSRKILLANNLVFAYAEAGRLEDAQRYLGYLSKAIHEEAYPTATLGLIHMRKGQTERGEQLYEEAIRLAKTALDKNRIRQKFNLERGLIWINKDASRARRFIQRAIDEKEGAPQLIEIGKNLLQRLPR